jgi:hypothetical protein
MRQTTQSPEDAKFRTALENMRYADCTPDDIAFLRTLKAGPEPGRPKLGSKEFRNVAIITAWNAHKDSYNELGVKRFAAENNVEIVTFYSEDTLKNPPPKEEGALLTGLGKQIYKAYRIDDKLQEMLWDLPPAATDHLPGKLSLCVGLPVMIRKNEATELCITKGQEGFVAGWQQCRGSSGQRMLDVLFVRLDKPPSPVQFEGLPENVVPIGRCSQKAKCALTDAEDTTIWISRDQVPVLVNFAMTDYAAQGKTGDKNPCDLNNCKDFQSYYTALSRSSSAKGTIIVQGFDSTKITAGISGYLRQEFRELELLDEITKLRYEGILPASINGHRRNTLIRQYRSWKGINHVPSTVHKSIVWSERIPFDLPSLSNDTAWQLVRVAAGKKIS